MAINVLTVRHLNIIFTKIIGNPEERPELLRFPAA